METTYGEKISRALQLAQALSFQLCLSREQRLLQHVAAAAVVQCSPLKLEASRQQQLSLQFQF